MAGLVPVIQVFLASLSCTSFLLAEHKGVDARDKPVHDEINHPTRT
jgi:hypothetical protein